MPGSVPQISSVDGDALEAEVDELPAVSYGYSKDWHARRR